MQKGKRSWQGRTGGGNRMVELQSGGGEWDMDTSRSEDWQFEEDE